MFIILYFVFCVFMMHDLHTINWASFNKLDQYLGCICLWNICDHMMCKGGGVPLPSNLLLTQSIILLTISNLIATTLKMISPIFFYSTFSNPFSNIYIHTIIALFDYLHNTIYLLSFNNPIYTPPYHLSWQKINITVNLLA